MHPSTTQIYTLSLHDALPIFASRRAELEQNLAQLEKEIADQQTILEGKQRERVSLERDVAILDANIEDRKSTRLNSSHQIISYAVFCLKKKNKKNINR